MGVIMSKEFHKDLELDGSIKAKAWDFLGKLTANADLTGLDLKKPKNPADPRVRTARVDPQYRAVLFAVGEKPEPMWLLAAVKNHDEAYELAGTLVYEVNPANGATELYRPAAISKKVGDFKTRPVRTDSPQVLPFTPDELIGVGINAEVAAEAVRLTTEDDILELAGDLPAWQQQVLLDLATGSSLDDVRATYGNDEPADVEDPLAAVQRAASRMEFVYLDNDDELRRMLEGDFVAWRTYLHPTQRSIAYRENYNGPFRLAGGAGTGKTVVALHRAAFLAARGRVLLCTFTRNLAANLRVDLRSLVTADAAARADVSGVDQLVRRVVEAVDGQAGQPLNGREEDQRWEEAVYAGGVPADLIPQLTASFLASEYRTVVLAQPEPTKQAYLKARRTGRGVRLNRVQRTAVWRVFEAFERGVEAEGRTTYDLLASRAATILADSELREKAPRYDHVVVDEGQDLHAGHWRILRGLVEPGPNDMFLCEDGHQRIYGERIVLGHFGIETRGRSRRLTLNYRTTRQNLRFAMSVIDGEPFVDLDGDMETTVGYHSSFDGPPPKTHGFVNDAEEMRFVSETVRDWLHEGLEANAIAVLSRRSQERDQAYRALRDAGVDVEVVDRGGPGGGSGVQLMTMHRSKGSEFSRVLVVGARDGVLPLEWLMASSPESERALARARERSLLYVACSRARDQLVVTWSGAASNFIRRMERN
ncbi:3'-5' exonuclease [Actinomycetospora sp. CA-084318]|uniref:3'-5' exonuclease n=1 Tax=Actinomycetospora sp. CA-084318 TaxID=3239892 RepID=UPI003D97F2FA